MTTKEDVLNYVKDLGAQNIVTRDELTAAYDSGRGVSVDSTLVKKLGVAEILYYIGGAIVCVGIGIFLWQNWSTLNIVTKIAATLGTGVAAYIVGLTLQRDKNTEMVASAFYLIAALVMPIGLFVVFDNAGFDVGSNGVQSFVISIILAVFLASFAVFRSSVFLLFSILYATSLFFTLTNFLFGTSPNFGDWKFYEYRTLVVGLTYMLLGHNFAQNQFEPLSRFLYGFGIFTFLGAAFWLGGWSPNQNAFWELIFPGLVFGALFLSVYVKSRSFLTWGTLYLMAYIFKITSEYFSGSLGWPLALVIAGLGMIAVGYMAIELKKKYM